VTNRRRAGALFAKQLAKSLLLLVVAAVMSSRSCEAAAYASFWELIRVSSYARMDSMLL
jgi:hypothetical protein